jgi:hypothetical protein
MLYAINEEGEKIEATPNAVGFCPITGNRVIPKCGEIYAWHWANKAGQGDPWRSGETEWHRQWKLKFMKSWREVVVEKYDEKHIANVKTSRFVIEFESSTPQTFTMTEKEQFFGNMVWVVNAEDFFDRIRKLKSGHYEWSIPRTSWTFTRKPVYFDDGKCLHRVSFLNRKGSLLSCEKIEYLDFIKLVGGEELI